MASARLAVLALFVVGCQCGKLPNPAIPAGRRAQYYTQQSDGAYKYGYDTSEGLFQVQEADPANEVQGTFGAEGGETKYTAGVGGFVVTSLKKATASAAAATKSAAPVRYATIEELTTQPKQVEDTPEVAAAKAKFAADYAAAAAAAEAAPDVGIITGAVPVEVRIEPHFDDGVRYVGPLAPINAAGHVEDTAEVKELKAKLQTIYNAAAAAAAAAPDANIIPAPAAPAAAAASAEIAAPAALYSAPAAAVSKLVVPAVVRLDAHGNLQDTPEVAAAKASFKATYDAHAALAEAAPDVNIIAAPVAAPAALYSAPAVSVRAEAAPAAAAIASKPVEIANFRSTANSDGSYEFSYESSDSSRHESADAANNVEGNFEFLADDAVRRRVDYSAGADTGFIASGAHLPVAVADTAEVVAAKASFKSAFEAAAAAAEAAPDDPVEYSAPAAAAAPVAAAPQTAVLLAAQPVVSTTYTSGGAAEDIASYSSSANTDGSYEFSYVTSDSSRHESADAANNVRGNFQFLADDAVRRRVDYSAGAETGFIASGAHLPVAVGDTAEVAAAKASFKSAFEAAAAAAEAAPDDAPAGAPAAAAVSVASPVVVTKVAAKPIRFATLEELTILPKPVADTPEVAAAKAAFKAAYDAHAALADAAPDVNIITGPAPVIGVAPPAALYAAPVVAAPAVTLDASGNVQDTAEVAAAKAAFKKTYAAQAAAAAAAPDVRIITASTSAAVKAAAGTAHQNAMRTHVFDGITLMVADGALSPNMYGYSYE